MQIQFSPANLIRYLIILSLFSLQGCNWPWNNNADTANISLSGTVETHEVNAAFQVGGRILSLEFEEGQSVNSGDIIAKLDATDLELTLQQVQAQADAAAATLAALQVGTRQQELRVAEADLVRAQAELKFNEAEVKRTSFLVPKQLASMEQLEQAQLRYEIALSSVEQANQRLLLAQEGPRQEDIQRAQAEFNARLKAVETAQQQLNYTQLIAPSTGIISLKLVEPGEMVLPGQTIARIAKLSRPWVRAYINEIDLARVKIGQKAQVRIDGAPDKVFEGTLSFISPVAEFTPKSVETRQLRVDLVYRIKVEVDNPQGILKLGMPADISLTTAPSSS